MIAQATAFQPVRFTPERQLITIEFAPNIHPLETEYSYEHPRFVFGDRVTLKNKYPETEYTVCALELIESKTPSGRLLSQPRWKYKISNGEVCFEKEELALLRYEDKSSPNTPNTCSSCSNFKNYNEPNGRGWCNQFNHQARTHHLKTNDCIISSQTFTQIEEEELEQPHSEYQIGSNTVRLIIT